MSNFRTFDRHGEACNAEYCHFVLKTDFDRVTAERDALRNEVGQVKGEYDRAVNKVDALQQRLTAADERVDVLEGLLRESNELFYAIQDDLGAVTASVVGVMRGKVFTALKPAEGGGDETRQEAVERHFGHFGDGE